VILAILLWIEMDDYGSHFVEDIGAEWRRITGLGVRIVRLLKQCHDACAACLQDSMRLEVSFGMQQRSATCLTTADFWTQHGHYAPSCRQRVRISGPLWPSTVVLPYTYIPGSLNQACEATNAGMARLEVAARTGRLSWVYSLEAGGRHKDSETRAK